MYPMESIAGHKPSERTAATLTAVLHAYANHLAHETIYPQS